ncbi:MAG: type II toxin-antitoxin system VapC family toxin [Hoeflea sp.]|uniref:type II toxin-antitoxin system VapC family toxin n=1 Tax=Hoeflea sp. TaxID=1940281 RepID=UPI001D5D78BA|nr:type II toxin-antitoxin system VapC family toxin [Hoeflea sp.]MBU4527610.1 type II toxin-antitoxin system VapC family toxin [Alphaproteobacteria bacterium]MBU4546271.1 type II toxin-antitoxin system VapC family toxin [Alphaproteobacteria bacterium]MBU4548882.1 type II toxin-antitoxin system VapC family toxin [Alphaproteobacteria bacterium]MBV1723266.1 type II toxin-antitoxin system VapC family toxin [Hoeflea sp.]MBV1782340.1 type II toxin-antitoxin system VapC family toxin [Hoeflea sp.]
MVIDTSAIVAILRNKPVAVRLERALVADRIRLVPATCVLEARMVLVSRRGEHAMAEIDLWLKKIEAAIIAVDADLVDLATQGWLTYGKGRHPAALNFADCISYALSKRADEPLLFIGNDFAQTDIEAA